MVAEHGVQYLFAAVVLTGILQISAGVLRLGKYIRIVPHPVMLAFVNGLAIVIFLAQLSQFKVPGTVENTGHGMGGGEWLSGMPLVITGGHGSEAGVLYADGPDELIKAARQQVSLPIAGRDFVGHSSIP